MNRSARLLILILILMLCSLVHSTVRAKSADERVSHTRTWKTLDELSEDELREVDLSTNTPRNADVPYLPAEPYPFTPPYTAEEMGYRAMEFTPRPRWNCVFANSWGSISSQGALLNPGKSITFVAYNPKISGVEAELTLKPGGEIYRSLSQSTFPPAAEGGQWLAIRYRTDTQFIKKEERYVYSPSIRRVRHQAPLRRQSKFPNMALTPDDAWGRDAWEFSWRFLGTDVLYETVRFPKTRPTILLRDAQANEFREVQTDDIKLMGSTYPYYTIDGGVECYVVEAVAREDWLPDYYVPRLLLWLEKHSFFPLRSEQYGPEGNLVQIEVRLAELLNPGLQERGYGSLFIQHWDIHSDIMSYLVNDSHRLIKWNPDERAVFFSPDFMRRQWYLDTSIKSQAAVSHPDEYFLRPALEADKFPRERPVNIPENIMARVRAQDAAGRLVFGVQSAPVEVAKDPPQEPAPQADESTAGKSHPTVPDKPSYVQREEKTDPVVAR